ncbi:MAG: hypothetical protein ACPG6V_09765 [Flavobacteriales bacterium]
MEYTEIIEENNGRKLSVNTIDWDGNEGDEMQLTVMQNDDEAFIDISVDEAEALRDRLTEWIETFI